MEDSASPRSTLILEAEKGTRDVSIKVYEAYRVREGHDPYAVLWEIRRHGQAFVREVLGKLYEDVLSGRSHARWLKLQEEERLFKAWIKDKFGAEHEGTIPLMREYRTWRTEHCPAELKTAESVYAVADQEVLEKAGREVADGVKPGVFDVDTWAHSLYGEQVTRHRKHPWALDVCVSVRVYRGRYYLIPYCERGSIVAGALDVMGEMEELEDFSYWNNTDPPESVPRPEWLWRGHVWETLTRHETWPEMLLLEVVSWQGWPQVSPAMEVAQRAVRRGDVI